MTWVPLSAAALCLDCDAVFRADGQCPACASESWVLLGRFLSGAVYSAVRQQARERLEDLLP